MTIAILGSFIIRVQTIVTSFSFVFIMTETVNFSSPKERGRNINWIEFQSHIAKY